MYFFWPDALIHEMNYVCFSQCQYTTHKKQKEREKIVLLRKNKNNNKEFPWLFSLLFMKYYVCSVSPYAYTLCQAKLIFYRLFAATATAVGLATALFSLFIIFISNVT